MRLAGSLIAKFGDSAAGPSVVAVTGLSVALTTWHGFLGFCPRWRGKWKGDQWGDMIREDEDAREA